MNWRSRVYVLKNQQVFGLFLNLGRQLPLYYLTEDAILHFGISIDTLNFLDKYLKKRNYRMGQFCCVVAN